MCKPRIACVAGAKNGEGRGEVLGEGSREGYCENRNQMSPLPAGDPSRDFAGHFLLHVRYRAL